MKRHIHTTETNDDASGNSLLLLQERARRARSRAQGSTRGGLEYKGVHGCMEGTRLQVTARGMRRQQSRVFCFIFKVGRERFAFCTLSILAPTPSLGIFFFLLFTYNICLFLTLFLFPFAPFPFFLYFFSSIFSLFVFDSAFLQRAIGLFVVYLPLYKQRKSTEQMTRERQKHIKSN